MFFTDSLPDIQDGFQTLELDDSPAANPVSWPKAFESHLHGIPPLPLCRILDMLQEPDGDLRDYGFGSRRLRGLRPREPQTPPGSPGLNRVNIAYPAPPPTPPSTPPCAKPKRNVHYRQFSGSGRDFDDFHCSGIVHPLPPQEGIPGFQRITMMKFKDPLTNLPSQSPSAFSSTDGILSPNSPLSSSVSSNSSHTNGDRPYPTDPFRPEQMENDHFQLEDDADVDDECWCYEGVVLPGGMMMLGRWWSPTNNDSNMTNMGPFIFWNVEDE